MSRSIKNNQQNKPTKLFYCEKTPFETLQPTDGHCLTEYTINGKPHSNGCYFRKRNHSVANFDESEYMQPFPKLKPLKIL
jgi:hypothetical protein